MPAIEKQLDFALGFARKIQSQGVKSVVVSQEATKEFNEHKDAVMQHLTFSGSCNSWYSTYVHALCRRFLTRYRYKGGTSDGRIVGPWPGSVNHFLESLAEPRLQDFEFVYRMTNRFAYLGKGLSRREHVKAPLGWYIRA